MKILLVTLQSINIGNRLQNYALQTVLKRMNHEVYTPYYNYPEYDSLKKYFKFKMKGILGKFGLRKYRMHHNFIIREKVYRNFNRNYICNRFKISFNKIYKHDWSKYDYAITGSDQVWHLWSNNQNELRYFYLDFISKDKRIAYAPSFGFKEFSLNDLEIHKKGLCEIKRLSCRELDGCELIEKITGRITKTVVDPTLLLPRSDWHKIEKRPEQVQEDKYVLVYFLGEMTKDYENSIYKLTEKNKLKIIEILNNDNTEYCFTTPDEFLWLVDHAEYICTDSFHGCVFSIIFHKKFMAFRRVEHSTKNMSGRIQTLLKMSGLEDRMYSGKIERIESDIEYGRVDSMISKAVQDSLKYLKESVSER